MEAIVTKVDSRHRITIPAKYHPFLPENSKVRWMETGDGLLISFEGKDELEFLTLEYLQNQIIDLRKDIAELNNNIKELRRMAFQTLIKPP